MSRLLLAGVLALVAAPALAQVPAAPPAPAGGQPLGGPLVAGVCLLSQQAVFANAKVGVMATDRLKQLAAQAQAGIDAEQKPLQDESKALEAQTKMKPAEKAAKTQAITARVQVLQQKAALVSREIEATRQKALGRIGTAETSVIAQAYKAHNCGLLVDRGIVLGGNLGGDLTADVVKGLDGVMSSIAFDLEIIPPGK